MAARFFSQARKQMDEFERQQQQQQQLQQRWSALLDTHRMHWCTRVRRADRAAHLAALDLQLTAYREFPACAHAPVFVPGRGSPAARVVFVAMRPSRRDIEDREAFASGGRGWVQLLESALDDGAVPVHERYFMYVLPYEAPPRDKDADDAAAAGVPDADEERAFLPYADRRLRVLQPRVVVALGARAANYVLGGFDARRARQQRMARAMPHLGVPPSQRVAFGGGGGVHIADVLECVHPFRAVETVSRGGGAPARNDAYFPAARTQLQACVAAVAERLCDDHVRGPPLPSGGVDASATMLQAAREPREPKACPRRKRAKLESAHTPVIGSYFAVAEEAPRGAVV